MNGTVTSGGRGPKIRKIPSPMAPNMIYPSWWSEARFSLQLDRKEHESAISGLQK